MIYLWNFWVNNYLKLMMNLNVQYERLGRNSLSSVCHASARVFLCANENFEQAGLRISTKSMLSESRLTSLQVV